MEKLARQVANSIEKISGRSLPESDGKREQIVAVISDALTHVASSFSLPLPVEIEEIRERRAKITAPPWKVYYERPTLTEAGRAQGLKEERDEQVRAIGTAWDHPQLKGPDAVVTTKHGPYYNPQHAVSIDRGDAEFIANAPTDIDTLLAAYEASEREVVRLTVDADQALTDFASEANRLNAELAEARAQLAGSDQKQDWCDHCSGNFGEASHILCEKCYRLFAGPKWWDRDFDPTGDSITNSYLWRAGVEAAAAAIDERAEFWAKGGNNMIAVGLQTEAIQCAVAIRALLPAGYQEQNADQGEK
jgi:hypothetical protein